jgi:ADP-ribose pyrophosphatase
MRSWKTLRRHAVFHHSKYLSVEEHEVQLPNGQIIADWPWIITPDYVNVLAVTGAGQFLCFRQTKYAVKGVSLAVVGGYLDPGEDPLAAARRELLEETGYEASQWRDLGHFVVGGNRGVATGYLFCAQQARQIREPDADDLEEQQLLLLSRAQLEEALRDGQFKVLSWATTVALALLLVGE